MRAKEPLKDSDRQKTGSKADPDTAGDVVGQVVGAREFAVIIEIGGHAFIQNNGSTYAD